MQYIKSCILKHARLNCSTGLNEHTACGRLLLSRPHRQMCMSSSSASSEDLMIRVLGLVKKFDKIDASKVTGTADFQKDLCLDSLDRVELVMALEQEFSVEIPDDKADKLSCCVDVVKYLSEAELKRVESS